MASEQSNHSKSPLVGIVTYHHVFNYGAVLQAFALSRFLELNGYRPLVVDYRPWRAELAYGVRFRARWPNQAADFQRAMNQFDRFRTTYLPTSDWSSHWRTRTPDLSDAVAVVFGSDEIWDVTRFRGVDPFFFGDFEGNNKGVAKVAYAPSCGRLAQPKNYSQELIECLREFKAISVRDRRSAEVVEDLLGVTPPLVLDPTLLLSARSYPTSSVDFEGKYLLVFAQRPSRAFVEGVWTVARSRGLKVYAVGFSFPGTACRRDLGVEQWLGAIAGAECVATDFYHGALFSLIFGKQVFTSPGSRKGFKLESAFREIGDPLPFENSALQCHALNSVRLAERQRQSEGYLLGALSRLATPSEWQRGGHLHWSGEDGLL